MRAWFPRAGSCRRRCRGICPAPRRGGRPSAGRPGRPARTRHRRDRDARPGRGAGPSGGRRRRTRNRHEGNHLHCGDQPQMLRHYVKPSADFSNLQARQPDALSTISLMTPSAALLSAYGSLLPVGFSSIAQKPTSVSSLSASATATDTGSVGTRSAGPAACSAPRWRRRRRGLRLAAARNFPSSPAVPGIRRRLLS